MQCLTVIYTPNLIDIYGSSQHNAVTIKCKVHQYIYKCNNFDDIVRISKYEFSFTRCSGFLTKTISAIVGLMLITIKPFGLKIIIEYIIPNMPN